MDWLNNVVSAAQAQSALEWIATITLIIYVILAARENIWCWAFGIVGTICSLIVYFQSKFFLDATLQVYYLVMSVYGWIMWQQKRSIRQKNGQTNIAYNTESNLPITSRGFYWHLGIIALGFIVAYPLGLLSEYFGGTLPYIDALTTSFALIATYMVAKKILENWLYWIVIDLIAAWAYWTKSLELFTFLFLIYAIIAVYGWFSWREKSPIPKKK